MKTTLKEKMLVILGHRINTLSYRKNFKRMHVLFNIHRSMKKNIQYTKAHKLLEILGYKNIILDEENTSTSFTEIHIGFKATPKNGRRLKHVIVFLTNTHLKAIVQQKTPGKNFSWIGNGQAHKNAENINF